MIKRIYRSKLDTENLSKLRTMIVDGVDMFNYKKVVVNKPWGYEYLMFENSYVAIWILYLKSGQSTSMHCHPNKKSSLIVLSGEIVFSTLDGWFTRRAGEGAIIEEAVFHCSKAASEEGSLIMEIESPPNKKDLVRLKDEYGRENQGYEDETMMSSDVATYEYIDFHEKLLSIKKTKRIRSSRLSLCSHKKPTTIRSRIKKESGDIICLLRGKLYDRKGNTILSIGEVASLSELKAKPQIFSSSDILFLTIHNYGKKGKVS